MDQHTLERKVNAAHTQVAAMDDEEIEVVATIINLEIPPVSASALASSSLLKRDKLKICNSQLDGLKQHGRDHGVVKNTYQLCSAMTTNQTLQTMPKDGEQEKENKELPRTANKKQIKPLVESTMEEKIDESSCSESRSSPSPLSESTESENDIDVIDLTQDSMDEYDNRNCYSATSTAPRYIYTVESIPIPVQEPYIAEDGKKYKNASSQTNTVENISAQVQTEGVKHEEKQCQTEEEVKATVANVECQVSTPTESKECQTDKPEEMKPSPVVNNKSNLPSNYILISSIASKINKQLIPDNIISPQSSSRVLIPAINKNTPVYTIKNAEACKIINWSKPTRNSLSNENLPTTSAVLSVGNNTSAPQNQTEKSDNRNLAKISIITGRPETSQQNQKTETSVNPNSNTPTTSVSGNNTLFTFVKTETKNKRKSVQKTQKIDLKKYFVDKKKDNISYQCLLCDALLKSIVAHYVNSHPDDEVLISRLDPTAALEAIESVDHQPKKQVLPYYLCRFCNLKFTSIINFKDHVATHTGEYRYKCSYCEFVSYSSINVESHTKRIHGKEDIGVDGRLEFKSKKLYSFFRDESHKLTGYICTECNFVQISIENVKKHIFKYHKVSSIENLLRKINFIKFPIKNEQHKSNTPKHDSPSNSIRAPQKNKHNQPKLSSNRRLTLSQTSPDATTTSTDSDTDTNTIFEQDTQEAVPAQKRQCTVNLCNTPPPVAATIHPVIVNVCSIAKPMSLNQQVDTDGDFWMERD